MTKIQDGLCLVEGDIIEALIRTDRGEEKMTDLVWVDEDGEWKFGSFDILLSEVTCLKIVGNASSTPWPLERPAL